MTFKFFLIYSRCDNAIIFMAWALLSLNLQSCPQLTKWTCWHTKKRVWSHYFMKCDDKNILSDAKSSSSSQFAAHQHNLHINFAWKYIGIWKWCFASPFKILRHIKMDKIKTGQMYISEWKWFIIYKSRFVSVNGNRVLHSNWIMKCDVGQERNFSQGGRKGCLRWCYQKILK